MNSFNFKKTLDNAIVPNRQKEGDIGLDLYASKKEYKDGFIEYDTGIAIEVPKGMAAIILPRSSISNTSLSLSNSIGLIDENFRGSIKVRFRELGTNQSQYNVGDKIAQLVFIPWFNLTPNEVNELSFSNRGENGFGSTGI